MDGAERREAGLAVFDAGEIAFERLRSVVQRVEGEVGVAADVEQDGRGPGQADHRDPAEQRAREPAFEEDRAEEGAREHAGGERADAGAGLGHADGVAVREDDRVAADADGVVVGAQDARDDLRHVGEQLALDLVVDEVEERAGDQPDAGREEQQPDGGPARTGRGFALLRSAHGNEGERERRSGQAERDGERRADAGAEDRARGGAEAEERERAEGHELRSDERAFRRRGRRLRARAGDERVEIFPAVPEHVGREERHEVAEGVVVLGAPDGPLVPGRERGHADEQQAEASRRAVELRLGVRGHQNRGTAASSVFV